MTTLRTAAQQALEALQLPCPRWNGTQSNIVNAAIDALRAALAEPDGGGNLPPPLQEPTVAETATTQQPVEQTPPSEYRRGYWDGFAIGKREGRIEAEDALAEPVQEPVAWIHTDPDKPRVKFLEWREDEPGYRGRWIKRPLYTSPPQRPAEPVLEEHFCPRCGKRTRDIHTCTPPSNCAASGCNYPQGECLGICESSYVHPRR